MVERSVPKRRRGGVRRTRGAWRRVAVLLSLGVVSSAWTFSLVSTSVSPRDHVAVPPMPTVPSEALEAPASVSTPERFSRATPSASSGAVAVVALGGVPAPALSAYHRAARVIDLADSRCHLDWSMLAAIGLVESDHGRHGDSVLRPDGTSTPGIYGVPLDGWHGTAEIEDTDAGLYDRDIVFDRAVGAMQIIPTTWAEVGVDADGDGKRNPQDIDDAALAAAVHLCSGSDDLSTDEGRAAAIYRYNHSRTYVRLVLALAAQYAAGERSTAVIGFASSVRLSPQSDDGISGAAPTKAAGGSGARTPVGHGAGTASGGDTSSGPGRPPADDQDEPDPADPPVLTALEKATAFCSSRLTAAQLILLGGLSQCAHAYLDGGANAVTASLPVLGTLTDGVLSRD